MQFYGLRADMDGEVGIDLSLIIGSVCGGLSNLE